MYAEVLRFAPSTQRRIPPMLRGFYLRQWDLSQIPINNLLDVYDLKQFQPQDYVWAY